eukprot:1152051-Pelagomonas_calceolata.AAC.4
MLWLYRHAYFTPPGGHVHAAYKSIYFGGFILCSLPPDGHGQLPHCLQVSMRMLLFKSIYLSCPFVTASLPPGEHAHAALQFHLLKLFSPFVTASLPPGEHEQLPHCLQ